MKQAWGHYYLETPRTYEPRLFITKDEALKAKALHLKEHGGDAHVIQAGLFTLNNLEVTAHGQVFHIDMP